MKKIISVLLVAVMCFALAGLTVFAEDEVAFPSPDGEHYKVTASVEGDKGGTASVNPPTVKPGEQTKIVAKPDSGREFEKWTFTGEFDWVSGDANSLEIVIIPKSDVHFVAHFKGEGGPNKDDGQTSPTTGYNATVALAVVAVAVVLSGAAVVYTCKRYYCATK